MIEDMDLGTDLDSTALTHCKTQYASSNFM